jgi:SprT-like family
MPSKTALRKCFEDFNHRFFNDRLYDLEVKWSKGKELTADGSKVCGYYNSHQSNEYKPQEIVLARVHKSSKWIWKLVLLHEMVHADLWLDHIDTYDHPPVFDDGMLKLANAGALVGIW